MLTYTYDNDGFCMGWVEIPDRPKGVGLPAQCTITAPPADGPFWRRARWTGTAWEVAEDHRGRIGHLPGGEAQAVTTWGPLPEGWIEGEPEPLPPKPEQLLAAFTAAIQAHLDAFAMTRNYDGILSAATYATSTVSRFRAEGQYAVEARDATWAAAYQLLAEVEGGTRPMPAVADVLAELPPLTWPGV